MESDLKNLTKKILKWTKTTRDKLDIEYAVIFPAQLSKELFDALEQSVVYESAENSEVQLFGKWYKIPRQQSAYGDPGTSYRFSGKTIAAKPWTPLLLNLRDLLFELKGVFFNFVLINRYANGSNYIGEHKDNESDLDLNAPIASLSLGQPRDFILRHEDCKKIDKKKNIPKVKILLENGSLLMMNPPTNKFWYHSLPPRKAANNVRINLTFRCIKIKK